MQLERRRNGGHMSSGVDGHMSGHGDHFWNKNIPSVTKLTIDLCI